MRTIYLVLLFFFITSCEDNSFAPEYQRLDDPFALKVGNRVTLHPDNFQIGFQKVISDSRCPSDAVCVWEGIADTQIWLLKSGADSIFINLSILGYVTKSSTSRHIAVDTLGYRIKLLQLDPYPKTTPRPAPSEYNAMILVSKL